MNQPHRILVSCGAALVTSTMVAKKITEELDKRGIQVITEFCKASEVPEKLNDHALVVTTSMVKDTGTTPVLHTVSFLTGYGMSEDLDKIIKYLDDHETKSLADQTSPMAG